MWSTKSGGHTMTRTEVDELMEGSHVLVSSDFHLLFQGQYN